ncbi:hypothetical protein ACJRO7_031636 [Eucalyptus globulus]|uniref:S-protein homolog n=1 Tax=Eucalyptus globulus TaxID=34317 RepID=A0ABD3JIP5_EUCGL
MVPSARILLVLAAIMALHQVNGRTVFDVFRIHARITNRLPGGVTLRVHCKSKDDDLGFHDIAPNKYWGFKFFPNRFNTLFYCSVQWPGHFHYFNVFDNEDRDAEFMGRWIIKPEGPCWYITYRGVPYVYCRKWNS